MTAKKKPHNHKPTKKQIKVKQVQPPMPQMMTVRQIAATGILPERAIRTLLKQNKLPAIYVGTKALINYPLMCNQLNTLNVRSA